MLHSRKKRQNERGGGVEIAQSLQAKRTNSSTKRTYQSKINIMKAWLSQHYPGTINTDTSELRVPLPNEAVLAFFGHICEAGFSCDHEDIDARDAPRLRRVLDGNERVISNLKKRGLMKINEGKRQLKASGYKLLARKLMSITPTKRGQSWATVLFGSRSDSIDTIMLQHVEWIDDALVIEEQGHKGDQTGVDKFGKHVYTNPYEPSQYPILAIGVHLLCCSYALGQMNGPTPVSVYLRMGQSMGKLKDRYIHFGEGADQVCGKMILGLPFNSERLG
ncbi:hypothetical protein L914_19435, partial [Phytophthora nicotianae]